MTKRIAIISYDESITSFLRHDNTTPRVFRLQDRDGILADDTDLAGKMSNDFDILAMQAAGSLIQGQAINGTFGQATGAGNLTDNVLYASACYLPKAGTLAGIRMWQRIQGNYVADQNNRVGLYSVSGGTATLVASSSNNGTLWSTVANGIVAEAFSSPYAAAAGLYYAAILYNSSSQTTAPQLATFASLGTNQYNGDFTNSNRYTFRITGQNDLPSSITLSSVSMAALTPFWAGLY